MKRMNQKFIKALSLFSVTLLLSGCLPGAGADTNEEELAPDEVTVQTTKNQISTDFYRAVITDGRYQLGATSSADHSLSSSRNMETFEDGLLLISQETFPTDQYYLQEGVLIDEETMTSWIERESPDNPEGLNPALEEEEEEVKEEEQAESVDPADDPEQVSDEDADEDSGQVIKDSSRTPIYLAQMMEKNIMVETDEGFALGGIVIGLAMNSTYTYTDSSGTVHEQEISLGEVRERGKSYANTIIGRLRSTPELQSVPILVGIFNQADSSDPVGGTYLLDGISREGNSVSEWTEHNEARVSLPMPVDSQNADRYGFFNEFQNDLLNFFPNLNGISGEAWQIDDQLVTLNIEIVTQFYQLTEISALSQYVMDRAEKRLPEDVPIEIRIVSAHGIEAYIGRDSDSSQFDSHVFRR